MMKLKKFPHYLVLIMIMNIQYAFAFSGWEMSPHEIRDRINHQIMSIEAPTPNVWSVKDASVQSDRRKTPIRIYTPNVGNHFPIILFIHGGAWVAGSLDTHDNLARYLCLETNAIVVSVGYTNSPEGKFPLPLEQCFDVLKWVSEYAGKFHGDHSKLAVVGDSAGGNMAAALCLMTRDLSGPKLQLQVLINPALDLTCEGSLERQGDHLDVLRWQAIQYLSQLDDANHPYVSLLLAEDLTDLPQSVVILAENDDLRNVGEKYASRLQTSNVSTQLYCQKGIGHLAGDVARASFSARESLDVAVTALRNCFKE